MKKIKSLFKNSKNLKIFSAFFGGGIALVTLVIPSIFFSTASEFKYINNYKTKATETEKPVTNEYKGDFAINTPYKKGDVVSSKEIIWRDKDLFVEYSTVDQQVMYEFTSNYDGGTFEDAPVAKFIPKFDDYQTAPLYSIISGQQNRISEMFTHQNDVTDISRSSVVGKYMNNSPGFNANRFHPKLLSAQLKSFVDKDQPRISLSNIGAQDFFTWIGYGKIGETSSLNAINSSNISNRFASNNAGLDIKLLPTTGEESIEEFNPSFNVSSEAVFNDNTMEVRYQSLNSSTSAKEWNLNSDQMTLFAASKVQANPWAINNSNLPVSRGYYSGMGALLERAENKYKFLPFYDAPTSDLLLRLPTDPVGKKILMKSSDILGYYQYNETADKVIDSNYKPVFNFSNGFFSLTKPIELYEGSAAPEIKWYSPLVSTMLNAEIKQDNIDKYVNDGNLASDLANFAKIDELIKFDFFNALPATFYGSEISMSSDNTTGTIWVTISSGTTATVSSTRFEKPKIPLIPLEPSFPIYPTKEADQETNNSSIKSKSIKRIQKTTYNTDLLLDGTGGDYTPYPGVFPSTVQNTENQGRTVNPGQEIVSTYALTGFPALKPTLIIDTNNPDGKEFDSNNLNNDIYEKFGPYRLVSNAYKTITPDQYIKKQKQLYPDGAANFNERYSDLKQLIFDNLVKNIGPLGVGNPAAGGAPWVSVKDLQIVVDPIGMNFEDQKHPEWGGRILISVTLNKYFDSKGFYVNGSGGFPNTKVLFSGFKSIPGPTSINSNYNLANMISGGAIAFNKANLPGTGVNYPSDYVSPEFLGTNDPKYLNLINVVNKWSNENPFGGEPSELENNAAFTKDKYMILNMPVLEDGSNPYTLSESDIVFNNFTGVLKITPKFSSWYNSDGSLVQGVNISLGTITISGFLPVTGATALPSVVSAITNEWQPATVVSKTSSPAQVDDLGNYIGQELYKIVWNDVINLPGKDPNNPDFTKVDITEAELTEIKKLVDIKLILNGTEVNPDTVDNKEGTLKFGVSFKRYFNKTTGRPESVLPANLWPAGWEDSTDPDDQVYVVTAIGYETSPGPTAVLTEDVNGIIKNRNVVVNQPNFQPSEFIRNDELAGFPLLKSIIKGNLINLPPDFIDTDIVLDLVSPDYVGWDPINKPLTADNPKGIITVYVYLKNYYDETSKESYYKDDNVLDPGMPYLVPDSKFEITGFMETNAKAATNVLNNDTRVTPISNPTPPSNDVIVDIENSNISTLYPQLEKFKNMFPYELNSSIVLRELINIKNKDETSNVNQPYLFLSNVPNLIKPYNIFIKTDAENLTIDNVNGTVSLNVFFTQWFDIPKGGTITFYPNLDSISAGVTEYKAPNKLVFKGLKKVSNKTSLNISSDIYEDSSKGIITLGDSSSPTEPDNSSKIIRNILQDNSLKFNTVQPNILTNDQIYTYIYAALISSGGSPYSFTSNQIIEQSTIDGSYTINDIKKLKEFIIWKQDPVVNLRDGTITITPILNLWFDEKSPMPNLDLQAVNQYAAFGAGSEGTPTLDAENNLVQAVNQKVELSGFLKAGNGTLFNNRYKVLDNTVLLNGLMDPTIDISLSTPNEYFQNGDWNNVISNNLITYTGISSFIDGTPVSPNNLSELLDLSTVEVNDLLGTISIKTKPVVYFDSYLQKHEGSITIITQGFKSSRSAYNMMYIVLVVGLVSLIIILMIILARVMWVKYNKSRNENN